jgi:hypothetical protein
MSGFKVNDNDLTNIFLANRGNGNVANTGFYSTTYGKDLSQIFEPSGNATSNAMISNSTGYVAINGLDLRYIFASINANFGLSVSGIFTYYYFFRSDGSRGNYYLFTGNGEIYFDKVYNVTASIFGGGGGGGGGGYYGGGGGGRRKFFGF